MLELDAVVVAVSQERENPDAQERGGRKKHRKLSRTIIREDGFKKTLEKSALRFFAHCDNGNLCYFVFGCIR